MRSPAHSVLAANAVAGEGYTRPTADGLYPHQWNWDSAFIALGWASLDPARGYGELRRLAGAQDEDGLIPHLAFSPQPAGYFPAANWWPPRVSRDGRSISAISQPPAAAICLRLLFERHPDERAARELLRPLHAWHSWWLTDRDPEGTGEPVVIHPWESGRDNSPDWDGPMTRVPSLEVGRLREDTRWVGLDQRPTDRDYGRYAWLTQVIRGWPGRQQRGLAAMGPFRVADPGVSCVLTAACTDLAWLADQLGEPSIREEASAQAQRLEDRLRARADADGLAGAHDLRADERMDTPGAGWALNLLRPGLARRALDTLEHACRRDDGALACAYGVRSWARADERFEPHGYWRGPVWMNVTWACALWLERHGRVAAARQLRERLARACEESGFREYYDGDTGEGLGARGFSWSAALYAWERARVSGPRPELPRH